MLLRATFLNHAQIRGLGQFTGESHIHVRVLDSKGNPFAGIRVKANGQETVTDDTGFVILRFPGIPVGTMKTVAVDLPEGAVVRSTHTIEHVSGLVEIFQSVSAVPKPLFTLPEIVVLALGASVLTAGFAVIRGKASDAFSAIGGSVLGMGVFSFTMRHLK